MASTFMGLFYDIASYVQRLAGGAKPSDITSLARAMNTSDKETPSNAAVLRLIAM